MAVVQWGMSPEQFWALHPVEFWWLADARMSQRMVGSMTEGEVEDLMEELEEIGLDPTAVSRKRRKEARNG